jgi:tRNA threonylcarbamoyl adenosine modification protein YjeE
MTKNEVLNKVLSFIPRKRIFLLEGELGSGKTFFIKALSKRLKINGKILSPTFILWQKYEFNFKNRKYFLNHLDLFRINAQDIIKIGLKQELPKKNNIFFIEWGMKLVPYLVKNRLNFVIIKINRQLNKRDYQIKEDETFSRRR